MSLSQRLRSQAGEDAPAGGVRDPSSPAFTASPEKTSIEDARQHAPATQRIADKRAPGPDPLAGGGWSDSALQVFLGAALVLYALLALFSYPFIDDYLYAVEVRRTGVLQGIMDFYTGWSGRYLTISLFEPWSWLMQATDFGLYGSLPVILLIAQLFSVWALLRAVAVAAGEAQAPTFWLAAAFVVAYLARFGSVFYWATGAIAYLVPNLLFVILVALVVSTVSRCGQGRQAASFAGAWLLAFLLPGGNEVTLLFVLAFLGVGAAAAILGRHPSRRLWIALLAAVMLGTLVLMLAPGNGRRAVSEQVQDMVGNVWSPSELAGQALWVADRVQLWVFNGALLGVLYLFTPFLLRIGRRTRLRSDFFPWKALILEGVGLTLIVGSLCSTYFLLGWPQPPKRLEACAYLFFVFGMLANVVLFGAWRAARTGRLPAVPRWWQRSAPAVFVLCVLFSGSSSSLVNVVGDLLFRAVPFRNALTAREEVVRRTAAEGREVVVLESLRGRAPKALPWLELNDDPRNCYNLRYAEFHGLRAAILAGGAQPPEVAR